MNKHTRTIPFRSRVIALAAAIAFAMAASGYAQTSGPRSYNVELLVSKDKKTVATDAQIIFEESQFRIVPDKSSMSAEIREIPYSSVTQADHSYSKKPMLSGGGAVATALLVGFIFALPFLFIKKKKHWMTVQAGDKFAVMQLDDSKFRQIIAEFEAHKVKVNDLKEEGK